MKFLKISFIIFLVGIFLLLIISKNLQPEQVKINQIDNKYLNKNIKITGKIINIKNYKKSNFQIITLIDKNGKIDLVLDKITGLHKNQSIIVIGKLTKYKKNLQIQVNIIKT